MASVHKFPHKSKYWFGSFTDSEGKRYMRSTRETNKNKALDTAVKWESLARGMVNEAHFRKVASDIYEARSGKPLHHYTCGSWLQHWLKSTSVSVEASSYETYRSTIQDFREFIGPADSGPLATISPTEITAYRDELLKNRKLAPTTVNRNMRLISGAFEAARRLGYITVNPCAGVKAAKDDVDGPKRDCFRPEHLDMLLEVTKDTPWEGMILLGAATGLRIGDAARLEWGQIDLEQQTVALRAKKTKRPQLIPLHDNFVAWLKTQTRGIGNAPVFPDLHDKKSGGCAGLSATFKKIREKAGVFGTIVRRGVEDRDKVKGNKARTGRQTTSLTYHSLRHTVTSQLANAGIQADQRKAITGHKDDRVHEGYTHYQMDTLKEAVKKIAVPQPKGKKKRR